MCGYIYKHALTETLVVNLNGLLAYWANSITKTPLHISSLLPFAFAVWQMQTIQEARPNSQSFT